MISTNTPEIKQELQEDEKLLWTGSPKQGILFRWADVFMVPYGVFIVGVGILAARPLLSMEIRWSNLPVVLSLLPQIAPIFYGFYLLVGRYLVDALQRRQTTYAVTNQRTVILSGFLFSEKLRLSFCVII